MTENIYVGVKSFQIFIKMLMERWSPDSDESDLTLIPNHKNMLHINNMYL